MKRIPDDKKGSQYFIHDIDGKFIAIKRVIFGYRVTTGWTKYLMISCEWDCCCGMDALHIQLFYNFLKSHIEKGGDFSHLPRQAKRPVNADPDFIYKTMNITGIPENPISIPFKEIHENAMENLNKLFES